MNKECKIILKIRREDCGCYGLTVCREGDQENHYPLSKFKLIGQIVNALDRMETLNYRHYTAMELNKKVKTN